MQLQHAGVFAHQSVNVVSSAHKPSVALIFILK